MGTRAHNHPAGEYFQVRLNRQSTGFVHVAMPIKSYKGRVQIGHSEIVGKADWTETYEPVTCVACIIQLDWLLSSWESSMRRRPPEEAAAWAAIIAELKTLPIDRRYMSTRRA